MGQQVEHKSKVLPKGGEDYFEERKAAPTHIVEKAPHYNEAEVECIDAIEASLTDEEFRGFCKGTAMRYQWRERHKGKPRQDIEKSVWYLQRMLSPRFRKVFGDGE